MQQLADIRRELADVGVGTITLILIKLGYLTCYLSGLTARSPTRRFIGFARTLATLPYRKDVADDPEQEGRSRAAHRAAVEEAGAGEVIVVAARGERHAAVYGDLFIERARVRGAAALLTDGCVRDTRNYPDGLAVFAAGVHTMTFRHALIAAQINVPVACAGALIVPGDLLVGDEDGVAVVPRALIGQVIEASRGQEALDGFLKHKISAGASLHEVAPPSAALLQEYQRTRGQP